MEKTWSRCRGGGADNKKITFIFQTEPFLLLNRIPVCSGSIVVTTLDCGPRGSRFKSRVGANIL